MKQFKVNDRITIVCEFKNTRNGFKHAAHLFLGNNYECEKTKVCYLNRTWESYEYQTVIHQLIDKSKFLTPAEKAECRAELG
jgi:hypothetical protein